MLKTRLLERLIASNLLFEEEKAPIETLAKVSDGNITNQDLYVTTSFAELRALIMN